MVKTMTVCSIPNDPTSAHSAGEEKMVRPTAGSWKPEAMRAARENQIKQSVKLLANER